MAVCKEDKAKLVGMFGKNANDTGSTEVQIAILTQDIKDLTEHCKKNAQDFSTKRGLLKKVCRRTRFLQYLKRVNPQGYATITERLGLRK